MPDDSSLNEDPSTTARPVARPKKRHLNYDLFGDVIPDVKKEPVSAPPTTDELDSDDFYFNTQKAHVPKYTEVKEGQEHPVGKHGQLKLFHEHVWPKGYTPQRLKEVRENAPLFMAVDADDELPSMDQINLDEQMNNEYIDHVARSTIPIDHLKKMQDEGIIGSYGAIPGKDYRTSGSFNAAEREFRVTSNSEYPPDRRLFRNIFGTRKSEEASTLVHEMGHAYDFASNPIGFLVGNRRSNYLGSQASPSREGFAEGYRRRYSRATRAMKRNEISESKSGYKEKGWMDPMDPMARTVFKKTRRAAFEGTFERPEYKVNENGEIIT